MKKILIVDDHAIVRKGLKEIINDENDLKVEDEAKNADEALEKIRNKKIDLVILDINMPGRSGFDIIADIIKIDEQLPILILSINPEDEFALRCLKAGASGYMNKDIEPLEFLLAIRKLLSGQKYIPPALAEMLFNDFENNTPKKKFNDLSDREFEVLRMIARKKTIKEISEDLALSIKTVSTYKTRIMQKLDLKDNNQLLNYARQNKLV